MVGSVVGSNLAKKFYYISFHMYFWFVLITPEEFTSNLWTSTEKSFKFRAFIMVIAYYNWLLYKAAAYSMLIFDNAFVFIG